MSEITINTEKEKKNIYEKMQNVRVSVGKKLTKSGNNTFSNFKYFELKDFLPTAMEKMKAEKLFSHYDFNNDVATLTIFDCESDDKIEFHCPVIMAQVGLNKEGKGGAQPIQNLGATRTYLKRYLYMDALEIVENDQVDSEPQNYRAENKTQQTKIAQQPPAKKPEEIAKEEENKKKFAVSQEVLKELEIIKVRVNGKTDKALLQKIYEKLHLPELSEQTLDQRLFFRDFLRRTRNLDELFPPVPQGFTDEQLKELEKAQEKIQEETKNFSNELFSSGPIKHINNEDPDESYNYVEDESNIPF